MGTGTLFTRSGGSIQRDDRLTERELLVGVLFGLWMVIGLFVDGWAHDNGRPESFFTPWHGILYSGFGAAFLWAVIVVKRRHRKGDPFLAAVPTGHGVTLIALGVFAIGATGDLLWHEVLGVEVGVEALLSPTHLLLLTSGVLALSAPFRAAWVAPDAAVPELRSFLPAVLSLSLMVAVTGFFLLWVSPFVNDAAGNGFVQLSTEPHDHPSDDPAELRQLLGVASIIVTTVLLVVPVQLVLRRWRPRVGTFLVLFGVVTTLLVGLGEFSQAPLIVAGLLAGAAADAVARRVPPWLTGWVATVVLWLAYFGVYQLSEGGVTWTAELWTGTTFLAGLVAIGVGLLGALRTPAPVADGVSAIPRDELATRIT